MSTSICSPDTTWPCSVPAGSGKSTLLKVLCGEAWPDQRDGGSVTWFDPRVPDEQGNPRPDTTPLTGRAMCASVSPALQETYMRQGWHVSGEEVVLSGLHDGYMLYGDAAPEDCEAARALARELALRHCWAETPPRCRRASSACSCWCGPCSGIL